MASEKGDEVLKAIPQANRKSRVLLVDDHPIVREGLEARINQEPDLTVCGTAEGAHRAMELIPRLNPDLLVTDLSLEGRPGLELVKDLEKSHPELPVVVLSIHDEMLWAERVLRAGARGYVMKSQATQKVVDAIRQVLGGGIWISERVSAILLRKLAKNPAVATPASPIQQLSDRELEIFQMIGNGLSLREIAARLYLSIKTVEVHREHIKHKLSLKSSAELVRYAITYALGEN